MNVKNLVIFEHNVKETSSFSVLQGSIKCDSEWIFESGATSEMYKDPSMYTDLRECPKM